MGLRLAQFGGVGGQYAPNSPGGSPMFQGGQSGYAGYAQNNFSGDIPMDDLMGRYRKSDILGFERPLESLLEIFHESLEQKLLDDRRLVKTINVLHQWSNGMIVAFQAADPGSTPG